jgi:predicted enzyme related to lactoylglutathione lyase
MMQGDHMELLVKEPFVRVAEVEQFIENLRNSFKGKVNFKFEHKPSESVVYALTTNIGRFSIVATDKEQPAFISKTIATYVVKNIDEVLAQAESGGLSIAQEKTATSVGFQARLKISDGGYMEIVEWNAEHISRMTSEGFKFSYEPE